LEGSKTESEGEGVEAVTPICWVCSWHSYWRDELYSEWDPLHHV